MVTVTFTLTASPFTAVSFDGQVVYGTKFGDTRYNQHSLRVASGNLITYDTGVNVVEGEIIVKNVTYADGELLRTWIHDSAVFQQNSFTISAIPEVDFGKGKNTAVTNVKFGARDTNDTFKYSAPGIYKLNIPYTFVRS